jgi:hypothetical protein
MGAMEKREANMLFPLHLITLVGPIDFGPAHNLKRQS